MKFVNKIHNNLRLIVGIIIIGILSGAFVKLFVISFFKIPTSSMAPALYCGDYILVNKWKYCSPFKRYLSYEGTNWWEIKKDRKIKRNDIIVFHKPWNEKLKKIEIDKHVFWVKRCIALPGDTLRIIKGRYVVNEGINYGDTTAQIKFYRNRAAYLENKILEEQNDTLLKWTLWNYGPLVVPGRGIEIELTPVNQLIYGKIIQYENTEFKVGSKSKYLFKNDWYFMAGDNVANSFDSRYWGCLPEECILGKVVMVVYSRNILDGEFRKERFFKKVE